MGDEEGEGEGVADEEGEGVAEEEAEGVADDEGEGVADEDDERDTDDAGEDDAEEDGEGESEIATEGAGVWEGDGEGDGEEDGDGDGEEDDDGDGEGVSDCDGEGVTEGVSEGDGEDEGVLDAEALQGPGQTTLVVTPPRVVSCVVYCIDSELNGKSARFMQVGGAVKLCAEVLRSPVKVKIIFPGNVTGGSPFGKLKVYMIIGTGVLEISTVTDNPVALNPAIFVPSGCGKPHPSVQLIETHTLVFSKVNSAGSCPGVEVVVKPL